jgi:hypothetical protein
MMSTKTQRPKLDPFWHDKSLDELASEQSVAPLARFEDIGGAGASLWNSDEEFEAFVSATQGNDDQRG